MERNDNAMTRFFRVPLYLAICSVIVVANAQQIQIDKNNRTIAITTTDNAKATADVARVHIGYTAYAPDAKAAYAKASTLSNAIVGDLRRAGVPETAIQSESQSISEQLSQPDNLSPTERAERRFRVSQSWAVISPAKNAGDVLNVALNAGANESGDINWSLDDEDALQAKASANALVRARRIAEQMAKGLNAPLGALIYASNEAPPPPNFALPNGRMGYGSGGGVGGGTYVQRGLLPLVIIPQEITKSATVYAVFALQ
jgi:uncharacterized protein YggE